MINKYLICMYFVIRLRSRPLLATAATGDDSASTDVVLPGYKSLYIFKLLRSMQNKTREELQSVLLELDWQARSWSCGVLLPTVGGVTNKDANSSAPVYMLPWPWFNRMYYLQLFLWSQRLHSWKSSLLHQEWWFWSCSHRVLLHSWNSVMHASV
jgi:hypothetical protein